MLGRRDDDDIALGRQMRSMEIATETTGRCFSSLRNYLTTGNDVNPIEMASLLFP